MQNTRRNKALAYLQLMRFPNVFTAMADVLAGYFVVMGPKIRVRDLLGLLLCSATVYAGGCVLNDIRDRQLDAMERPFRPIPSGRVTVEAAYILLGVLFGVGLLAALWVGRFSFITAVALTLVAVAYDIFTKDMAFIGPLNMGGCRSINILLGMSTGHLHIGWALLFSLMTLVYVFSLTVLSRFEVHGGAAKKARIVVGGWVTVVAVIVGLLSSGQLLRDGFLFLVLFLFWTGLPLFRGLLGSDPALIGRAVKFMVLGIPLLDAVYAAGVRGWPYGVVAAFCIVPALLISRYLYVT